jgi:uncharacterized protein (TIGR04255 family)
MPKYLPFAGKNAIAEMNIGVQFATPLEQIIAQSAEGVKTEFANEFPKFEPLQMFTINFGMPQVSAQSYGGAPVLSGFNLTKPKSDGSPARVLRLVSNTLSVHFLEYTSWQETKAQAISYIARCLEKLPFLDRNPITAVLLRYIDRFTFDGVPQEATASILFRPGTKFVASRILGAGYQWHSNSGWFEPLIGATLVLNQLNVSSGIIQGASAVIVDHNSAYTLPKPYASVGELKQGEGGGSLEAILDGQHRANEDMLKNLLNQEMLDTIGLKG